jgi:hypothetical protein
MPPDIRTAFFALAWRIQMLGAIVRRVESAVGRLASAVMQVIDVKGVARERQHGETGMPFASHRWLAKAIIV